MNYAELERYYCAFDGEKIAAFCCLSDMGRFQGKLVQKIGIQTGSSVEQRRDFLEYAGIAMKR